VKGWMEDTRLFRVIIISISIFLVGCSTSANKDYLAETKGNFIPMSERLGDEFTSTAPGMLWSTIQYMKFSLNDEEKSQHKEAVYFALNNLEDGKIVHWYSKKNPINGKVRVIYSYPTSTRVCRVYQAFIQVRNYSRHFTNNACSRLGSGWVFLK
jgi:surface antigen